jgi:cytochrome c-type biogenesis protein
VKRLGRIIAALAVIIAIVLVAVYLASVFIVPRNQGTSASLAPDFTLTDISGRQFTLSDYRNNSVVVIDFTSLSCGECQNIEQSLKVLYATYNSSGDSSVKIISIYIEPQFGDTIPNLKAYQAANNITWTMAQDTPTLSVKTAYGVSDIPNVVIINKQGYAIYDETGAQGTGQIQSAIQSAGSGTSTAINIAQISVFALAVIAGIATFFSPCAFPMLPGYMSLYLGLNTNVVSSQPSKEVTYKGAARRAVIAGSATALGMMTVFLVIGVVVIIAASTVTKYIPYLQPIVGVVLVVLGLLLLTNLQYWRIVAPFQRLGQRLRKSEQTETEGSPTTPSAKGFYLKLFTYGTGYGASAAGCIAPLYISVIVVGMLSGWLNGLITILLYSLTAALLMIVITVMLSLASQKYVDKLKSYTPLIKKISAVVLVIVGVYLVAFYYFAWIA